MSALIVIAGAVALFLYSRNSNVHRVVEKKQIDMMTDVSAPAVFIQPALQETTDEEKPELLKRDRAKMHKLRIMLGLIDAEDGPIDSYFSNTYRE